MKEKIKKFIKENWKECLGGIIGFVLFSAFLIWIFLPSPTFDNFIDKICFPYGYENGYVGGNIGIIRYLGCSFIFNIDYGNRITP